MHTRRVFAAFVGVVSCVSVLWQASAQEKPEQTERPAKTYDFAPLTESVENGYKEMGLPGAALLVHKDGKVIYEKFFGEYDEHTKVPIASSSKWLSAATIMTLVDEGKLDLDAPLSKYLPNFEGNKGQITVRQLFSHTSGLVDFRARWDYTITMAQYADKVAIEGVLAADPGTEVRYASIGMQVGGAIAERVSGTTWNDLFTERIAVPCDMPDTTFARSPSNRNPMLAGGASSTLRDYGHFLEMIINNGSYKGKRVLSEKAIREMQKDQTKDLPLIAASNDRLGRKSHYGLGEWIDVQDDNGNTVEVSSPGAFGFRPWLDLSRNLFGVFMIRVPRAPGQAQAVFAKYDPWALIDRVHRVVDEDGSR